MAKITESNRQNGGKNVRFDKDATPIDTGDKTIVVETKRQDGGKHVRFGRGV